MAKSPYRDISTRNTLQTDPIPGTVANSAGGQSFPVDDWSRLRRFLVLGTEGGSYYASEKTLTKENAQALFRCIKADGGRTVAEIVEISIAGRAAKQQPTMLALAACAGADEQSTRDAALAALPLVCRTGTHLFLFIGYVEQFRGWGRGLRRAVGNWYTEPRSMPREDADATEMSGAQAEAQAGFDNWLALQLVKYQQREGWSHRDVLRLAKPRPARGSTTDRSLGWAVGKPNSEGAYHMLLQAHDELHEDRITIKRAAQLIELFRVPWEAVPSELLTKPEIWKALLPSMGIGALVRNLGRLSANGTLKPMSAESKAVIARLTNAKDVERSRLHPYNVLTAAVTYGHGQGLRGSLSWNIDGRIADALGKTFELAFPNVVPAGKRTLIGLDVSGSMGSFIQGGFLSARVAAAAMALITYRTEPDSLVMAFSNQFRKVSITPTMGLADLVRVTNNIPFGSTDCSLPMEFALKANLDVDTFVVYTDSETYAGRRHPVQALQAYRAKTGINAKLIVVAMTSNGFSIADPNDAGMLDVVGFDSAAPALIADFSAGRV